MKLVEKHIISKEHSEWNKIDHLAYLSKNLYNYTLYRIKNAYEETSKILRYTYFLPTLRKENQVDFRSLPSDTSGQIIQLLDKNIKSFFSSLRCWKKDKTKFKSCPQFPKFKHKTKGRNIIIFSKNQFRIKGEYLYFPKSISLNPLKTKVFDKTIKLIRIVPQKSCYVIEIVYDVSPQNLNLDKGNYLAIDLGVNNIVSCVSNQPGLKPFLINGKYIKSINSYFNKLYSKSQSQLKKNHNKFNSNKLNKLLLKRNNKLNWSLHHVSKRIIQYCIENNIGSIVVGYNPGWKQNSNMGKKNNQTFNSIPFLELIQQITYKGELVGINVEQVNEAYTSKCSALDMETVKKHETYVGSRIKRGLFKTSKNILLNADINGALNILRNVIGNSFIRKLNIGFVVKPVKLLVS